MSISPPRETGTKTIDPSLLQVPPRGVGASASVIGEPPSTAIFFSLLASKNAPHCESGEKNGCGACIGTSEITRDWRSSTRRRYVF